MQPNIIGVRFTKIGKIYHFNSAPLPDIKPGEHVIVDTARGKHLGQVVQVLPETPAQPEGGWKTVERRATPRDLLLQQSWQSRQTEAMINCRARSSERFRSTQSSVKAAIAANPSWLRHPTLRPP